MAMDKAYQKNMKNNSQVIPNHIENKENKNEENRTLLEKIKEFFK